MRATHDNCDEDDLTQEAEEGLHDLEEVCEAINCNSGSKDVDPFVCVEDDDSGASVAALGTVLVAGAAVLAL